jgi:F420-dependent oxidoreductase-like protein
MIEGQNGLTWARWTGIARLAEELGFHGLYRSDHFTNAAGPDLPSLELWTSLTWLADNSERLVFGPMVTPCSYRDPVFTARMGRDVDDLSHGRLTLGVGAGWQAREHAKFGYALLTMRDRMLRFEESLQVISGLLQSDDPVTFKGRFYSLDAAQLLPRPGRQGGPPLLIGGKGERRTLPLVARFATGWNAAFLTGAQFEYLNRRLDTLLERAGRARGSVHRSLMTGLRFGQTSDALDRALNGQDAEALRERGVIVATAHSIGDELRRLERVGVEEVMLQWLALDDLDGLAALAQAVL